MKQTIERLFKPFPRRPGDIFRAVSEIARRRLSYFMDMRRVYRILPPPLRKRFWVIMGLQAVRAILETSSIFVIALFTQSVSSPARLRSRRIYGLVVPLLPDYVIQRLNGDRTLITAMCLMVVLFIVLKNIIVFVTRTYTAVYSENIGLYASAEAYKRYFSMDYLWHISPASRDVINRINHRGQLTGLVTSLLQMFGNVICAAVMFGMLFTVDARLTALVIAIFAIVCLATYISLRKKVDSAGKEIGQITSRQNWSVQMANRGIREILIYRKQQTFLDNIVNCIREGIGPRTFLFLSGSIPGWLLEISGFIIIFAVMYYMVDSGLPMPDIIAAMSLLLLTAWRLLPMISRSMGLAVNIRAIHSRAISCLELLEGLGNPFAGTPKGEEEKEKAGTEAKGETRAKAETGTGANTYLPEEIGPAFHFARAIELNDVSFQYPGAKKPSLRGVRLAIAKGERVGLVGKSGAGKSTLGMILAGLFQPQGGRIVVDGVELTADRLGAYRKRIGYVPQNPLLLPGTIADNVALSEWGERHDAAKLAMVCAAAAMDFVLPGKKGLNFVIGDGGDGLSGGEAQRVSIARALYTDPEILIFDEATSSLDRASEERIEQTLEAMRGRTTALVIAHRLTTVEQCDRIVWMENGAVKEMGTPEEILPKYAGAKGK